MVDKPPFDESAADKGRPPPSDWKGKRIDANGWEYTAADENRWRAGMPKKGEHLQRGPNARKGPHFVPPEPEKP